MVDVDTVRCFERRRLAGAPAGVFYRPVESFGVAGIGRGIWPEYPSTRAGAALSKLSVATRGPASSWGFPAGVGAKLCDEARAARPRRALIHNSTGCL